MKKKIIGIFLVVSIVVVAFAVETNWCATAKCFECKAVYHNTIGASTKKEAIREAKAMIDHEPGCHKLPRKIKATVAVGACPAAPSSEFDGE